MSNAELPAPVRVLIEAARRLFDGNCPPGVCRDSLRNCTACQVEYLERVYREAEAALKEVQGDTL
jgi:hypothetical protein